MRKYVLLLIALVYFTASEAQPYKYWIEFTDKNGSPYSVSNPTKFLSARAIARRVKFGIPVQYNDLPPNPNYIDSVISKGVQLLNRSGWFNAISIYASDTTKLAAIRALPFVKHGRLITIIKPKKSKISKYKPFNEHNRFYKPEKVDSVNYGFSYGQVHQIGVDCLNNAGYRGKGMRIAVIDTRFGRADSLPAYDSLRVRGQILATWDFVWEIPWVYDTTRTYDANSTMPGYQDAHGQEVLSCIAGNLPGTLMGDAMDADFYLLRTEDAYSEHMIEPDNWASAAEYADSAGANIITSSLGYNTFDEGFDSFTYADMNGKVSVASMAATIASEKGMVVCVAAGNEACGSASSCWQYITSPGDADSILTVGAVDNTGAYANFSSTGPTSDKRIKPDVVAQGVNDVIAPMSGGATFGSGTSFATPLIAGGVASLWQTDTNASNFKIMNAIKQSASQYTHPDTLLGYGIPNFCLAKGILLGMEENKAISALVKSFPDPFTDHITLTYYSSLRQNVNISLYNSIGQQVFHTDYAVASGGNTLVTLNGLQNLSSGLYIIVMTDQLGMIYTSKVMKQ